MDQRCAIGVKILLPEGPNPPNARSTAVTVLGARFSCPPSVLKQGDGLPAHVVRHGVLRAKDSLSLSDMYNVARPLIFQSIYATGHKRHFMRAAVVSSVGPDDLILPHQKYR